MKVLIIILLLLSCGLKVQNTKVIDQSLVQVESEIILNTQSMSFNFDKKIDIFVAFLWPLRVTTTNQQLAIENVLKLGKELRIGNEELLGTQTEFNTLRCEQIFSGELEVTYEEEEYCYQLEEKKLSLTASMLEKVTQMEDFVRNMGGEWLESNQDFETNESSLIDFSNNTLSLFSMGHEIINGEKLPLTYTKLPFEIKTIDNYSFIELFFPRKNEEGIYKVKADLNFQKHSLIFQGDLDLISNGQTRRGIIYWQILRKSARR